MFYKTVILIIGIVLLLQTLVFAQMRIEVEGISPGEDPVAIVNGELLKEGDKIGEYTVQKIEKERVVFKLGDKVVAKEMKAKKPKSAQKEQEISLPVVKLDDGVEWNNKDNTAKIILKGGVANATDLIVSSKENLTVIYRSCNNSAIDVVRELKAQEVLPNGDKRYIVEHFFTKTSPWMSIEIHKNGEMIKDLTRTFYGNVYKSVPNDRYRE
ncbi:MAG: hypothetical protein HY810_01555 [Candidatus Omnitrophica bacterium]|nr:hypothetical protein [Candidatus Omnitrophota bacterium]